MNQEQHNLNPNNYNAQGNNGIPNNQPQQFSSFQQPVIQDHITQHMNNTFENNNVSNQIFNNKPPKKANLGLLIKIFGITAVVGIGIFFTNKLFLNNKKENININSNNSVDLTINESIPKSITCNIVSEGLYAEEIIYSYEYVLPNWDRYTFLEEYKAGQYEPENVYVVDHNKECKENRYVDNSTAITNDFELDIHYRTDQYSSATWSNIKERATGHIGYTEKAGKPPLYGNENGYWYAYMIKEESLKDPDKYLNKLNVVIWKEMDKIENAHKTPMGGNIVGDEYHALNIYITLWYNNETGKIRLNYLLNDLKESLTEKYNLDLSELTVDMIKK